MNRRGFLFGTSAALVSAGSLMKISSRFIMPAPLSIRMLTPIRTQFWERIHIVKRGDHWLYSTASAPDHFIPIKSPPAEHVITPIQVSRLSNLMENIKGTELEQQPQMFVHSYPGAHHVGTPPSDLPPNFPALRVGSPDDPMFSKRASDHEPPTDTVVQAGLKSTV